MLMSARNTKRSLMDEPARSVNQNAAASLPRMKAGRARSRHHRHVGRREVFARSIEDDALAVLCERVLLGDAFHTGKAAVFLVLAVDQVVVRAVAQRNVARAELGELAEAAFLEAAAFFRGQRAIWVPCVGED